MQAVIEEEKSQEIKKEQEETVFFKKPGYHEIFGSILGVTGLLLLLSLVSHNPAGKGSENLIGTVGYYSAWILFYIFGAASFLAPPYILLMGYFSLRRGLPDPLVRFLGLFIMLVSTSLFANLLQYRNEAGLVGRNLGDLLEFLFGFYGSFIITAGLFITSAFMSSQIPSRYIFEAIYGWFYEIFYPWLGESIPGLFRRKPPASAAAETAGSGLENETMKIKQEETDYKPWIEKLTEEIAGDIPAEDPYATEIIEKKIDLPRFERKLENTRLENLLGQLDKKYNPDLRSESVSGRGHSEEKTYFSGHFSQDNTRFIFHAGHKEKSRPQVFRDPGEIISGRVQHYTEIPGNAASEAKSVLETISKSEVVNFNTIKSVELTREEIQALHEGFFETQDLSSDEADVYSGAMDFENYGGTPGTENPEETVPDDEVSDDEDEYVEVYDRAALSEGGSEDDIVSNFREKYLVSEEKESDFTIPPVRLHGRKYYIPPELLNAGVKPKNEDISREIESTKAKLEAVMQDYGIQARVVTYQRGPIVTLYEVKLEPGVKVSKINGIYDEIKMNLAAASLRIIAPIPGKSTIGIEIPNKNRESVELGQMVRNDRDFFSKNRELSISLGKNITGENVYVDLVKLPHLLIAGATGAGKSVYMNAVIASLLYTHSPEELRFIMIDPKMVELKLYDGIPHLLMPVITDVRKASRSLQWAVQEMERRYMTLSSLKVRDIRSYNQKISRTKEKMPYVVILIDELSDLMMVAAKDVEDSIIRLTQKARAVGIHMIMATQRPSVDVITALIKANCPARISFQVSQKTDSRTILDANGAETLMGKGDMLYRSPIAAGLERIQAPMISENEIERIVGETLRYGSPGYIELPEESSESYEMSDPGAEMDPALIQEAWRIIQESGKTSTSYVQRRLRIGYNRAATIVETLEDMGYLGPVIGNRPREILKRS